MLVLSLFSLAIQRQRLRILPVSSLSLLSILAATTGSSAAERIEFVLDPVGALPITVTVKDLRQFAETGTATGAVQLYTKLAPKAQEEELKAVLLQPYRIAPTTIEQFTATQLGSQMLRQVSTVIRLTSTPTANGTVVKSRALSPSTPPPSTQAKPSSPEPRVMETTAALKAAILESAKNPNGFTLLSFLEEFPHPVLRIDLNQSVVIVRELFRLFQQHKAIVNQITQQTQTLTHSLPLQPPSLAQSGSYQWQQESLKVYSPDRQRSLNVDLYRPLQLPRKLKSTPLVVISHGLASNRETFSYLARHLASQGYAVAAVEHPNSSAAEIQRFFAGLDHLEGETDWLNRPGDIRYLLDTLAQQPRVQSQYIPINIQQVGMVGQSFGGYTSLALAGAELDLEALRRVCPRPNSKQISLNIALLFQCEATALPKQTYQLRDPRIKAVIAVNTIGGSIFSPKGIAKVNVPTLMISGTDDVIAPTMAEQVIPFSWLTTPDKYLVLVDHGTHFSFLGGEKSEWVVSIPKELQGPDPKLAHPLLQGLSTAFFNRYLRQQSQSEQFLTNAAVQDLTIAPFSAHLVKELDPSDLALKL